MKDFLLYIGIYNLIGAVLLMSMHSEKTSDTLLRKITKIINEPYSHGPFGRMWLWWAANMNLFLGTVMILSTRWSAVAQKEVCLLAIGAYIIMYLVMILGAKKPKYGRGIYVTHLFWMAQILWGLWVLYSSIY